ncbi:MAG: hypothetical protein ACTHQQ_07220, partial [Solirubrobacteraceae bacterium]
MPVIAETDAEFKGLPDLVEADAAAAFHAQPADHLGPLADLDGPWKGHGFNAIWRPHRLSTGQDRFLELNLTTETLDFKKIHGAIPNRG